MIQAGIGARRMVHQCIVSPDSTLPVNTVRWMTAMQAQDYTMAKWAVGLRTKHATETLVEEAFSRGEILRTHVLRPTWHFVAGEDIHWMIELTAPHIKSSMASRQKQLELTPEVVKKSNNLIVQYLSKYHQATRKELVALLEKAGFSLQDNRAAHLLMLAELELLICSGPIKGKEQTYALVEERAPEKKNFERDEALAELAKRYFSSHGPATLNDFKWWSGLPVKDARNALEMIKPDFIAEEINAQTYWLPHHCNKPENNKNQVYLLPAYDEYIISYKDRSAIIDAAYQKNTISSNGIFWPTIVMDGQVKGLWKSSTTKNKVSIETNFFKSLPETSINALNQQTNAFKKFLAIPELAITHKYS